MKAFLKKLNLHYHIKDYKFGLVIPVVVLAVFGVFMVYSARPELMTRQVLGVALGIAAMVVISLVDYNWVLKLYWPLYFLNLILLSFFIARDPDSDAFDYIFWHFNSLLIVYSYLVHLAILSDGLNRYGFIRHECIENSLSI